MTISNFSLAANKYEFARKIQLHLMKKLRKYQKRKGSTRDLSRRAPIGTNCLLPSVRGVRFLELDDRTKPSLLGLDVLLRNVPALPSATSRNDYRDEEIEDVKCEYSDRHTSDSISHVCTCCCQLRGEERNKRGEGNQQPSWT